MFPFEYPRSAHKRRHGPVYDAYQTYRPWLRDEFCFRCVYCFKRERWGTVTGEWDIDHFTPQARSSKAKVTDYDNLVYACRTCNSAKGKLIIPDPLSVMLRRNIEIDIDGSIRGRTKDAKLIIRKLGLDSREFREFRAMWICIANDATPAIFKTTMGFPTNLPNLAAKKPRSNKRMRGVKQSYYSLRQDGKLPDNY